MSVCVPKDAVFKEEPEGIIGGCVDEGVYDGVDINGVLCECGPSLW